MTAETSDPAPEAAPTDETPAVLETGGARIESVREPDRTFKIAMGLAFLVHALVFLSLIQAKPRPIGNPSGSPDAISVSILTEKDLRSRATIDDAANPGPPGPATPPPPPLKPAIETPPPTPVEEPAPKEPPPEPLKEEPKPEETKPAPEVEPKPQPQEAETPKEPEAKAETEVPEKKEIPAQKPNLPDKALQELLEKTDPLDPAKKRKETEAQQAETQQQAARKAPRAPKQQVPDMAMPGGGAGIQRPPGYTKSGENDAFARGVIRALQRTMPQLRNTFGTVTVRIDLDRNGNLVKVTVMRPSGVAGLDQSVAFAVQQSSFPLPPVNATPADLTFFVRYVYN